MTGILGLSVLLILAILGTILFEIVFFGAGQVSWEFLTQPPKDSLTAGGIYRAIVGTAALVILMTIAAVPLGVAAAVYLHEYTPAEGRQRAWVRFVRSKGQGGRARLFLRYLSAVMATITRMAVANLAGVPSIVFGLFGLGFFIQFIGSRIDSVANPGEIDAYAPIMVSEQSGPFQPSSVPSLEGSPVEYLVITHAGALRALEPAPWQAGGPEILAGAMGPRSIERAARWADGLSGFSFGPYPREIEAQFDSARRAWRDAGRPAPRLVTSFWYALGPAARAQLDAYRLRYLNFLGEPVARRLAPTVRCDGAEALRASARRMRDLGCDELILVPTTSDPDEVDRVADLLGADHPLRPASSGAPPAAPGPPRRTG